MGVCSLQTDASVGDQLMLWNKMSVGGVKVMQILGMGGKLEF